MPYKQRILPTKKQSVLSFLTSITYALEVCNIHSLSNDSKRRLRRQCEKAVKKVYVYLQQLLSFFGEEGRIREPVLHKERSVIAIGAKQGLARDKPINAPSSIEARGNYGISTAKNFSWFH
jgi:hypothetical protein